MAKNKPVSNVLGIEVIGMDVLKKREGWLKSNIVRMLSIL